MLRAGLSGFRVRANARDISRLENAQTGSGPRRCIQRIPTSQKTLRLKLMLLRGITDVCLRVMRKLRTEWAKHRGL